MRRIVCLCMIVVLFAAGCSEKDEMKSNELFYFVEEDGQHYIVPKEPLPEFSGHNAYIDWEIISVCFYSFDEMKYCIENGIFEYGHLFGIGDHYGRNSDLYDEDMPSTEEKNAMSDVTYSQDCIYGENRMDQAEKGIYELCDGCKRDMEVYIEDFLVKWGY